MYSAYRVRYDNLHALKGDEMASSVYRTAPKQKIKEKLKTKTD